MRRLVVVAAFAALAVACSDDGGSGGDRPRASVKRFCQAIREYDEKGDFSDEATRTAYAEFQSVAPRQIKRDLTILREALDRDVIGDERTAEAGDRFTAYVEQACGISLLPDDA
jgi:hypothetical protein